MITRRRYWIFLLAACAACAPRSEGEEAGALVAASTLLASVQATTFGRDSVQFTLQVTNVSEAPVELQYNTGQTYDFVVTPAAGGAEVWRWSSEMMFTQALRTERLAAGQTQTHTATWVPGTRGEFVVQGMLTASNATAEQSTRFRLE